MIKGLALFTTLALGVAAQGTVGLEIVGQVGGPVLAVDVAGDYAFVGVGPRLHVVDVSNPQQPSHVAQTAVLPDVVEGVDVVGTHAYVVAGHAGLRVIDVSDPAAPCEVGSVATRGHANGVHVAGTHAFVAVRQTGLLVIDVSDPTAPREIGGVDTSGYAYALAVHVAGTHAYVADGFGLRVIDVSEPAAPRVVGGVDTPGLGKGVHVIGARAYVAAQNGGLLVVRVRWADPAWAVHLPVVLRSAPD